LHKAQTPRAPRRRPAHRLTLPCRWDAAQLPCCCRLYFHRHLPTHHLYSLPAHYSLSFSQNMESFLITGKLLKGGRTHHTALGLRTRTFLGPARYSHQLPCLIFYGQGLPRLDSAAVRTSIQTRTFSHCNSSPWLPPHTGLRKTWDRRLHGLCSTMRAICWRGICARAILYGAFIYSKDLMRGETTNLLFCTARTYYKLTDNRSRTPFSRWLKL